MDALVLVLLCLVNEASLNNFANNTFRVNGMFSLETDDGINYQSGFVMSEALKFAIRKVNRHHRDFLYGYKLKMNRIYDIKNGDVNRISEVSRSTFVSDIPFVVGPYSSETSYVTNILSRIFRHPVISYGATYSGLNDVDDKQNSLFRTVPSNSFRTQALYAVMKKFRWNYVSIIASYGYDGERDVGGLTRLLPESKICVGTTYLLPRRTTKLHYEEALDRIKQDKRARVLLLFTNVKDSKNLIEAIALNGLKGRFQLFCVFGCAHYVEVIKSYEDVADGILNLDPHIPENKEFARHLLRQNPILNKKKSFSDFWESFFNCTLPGGGVSNNSRLCDGTEKLTGSLYKNTPVNAVIDAVYAIACAVRGLVQQECKQRHHNGSLSCNVNAKSKNTYNGYVIDFLLNSTFDDRTINIRKAFRMVDHTGEGIIDYKRRSDMLVQFDLHRYSKENGTFKHRLIGSWSTKRNSRIKKNFNSNISELYVLPKSESTVNLLTGISCSSPCQPGYFRVSDSNILRSACCWSCSRCPGRHISVNETCVKCAVTQHVRDNRCEMLPQKHVTIANNKPAIIFILFSVIGFISVGVVASIFIRYNDHKVVRASGRDLFYIMLLGIFLTFTCPLTMLAKPSALTCVSRGILPGIAFLTCYAPLFLKTNRIHRIFIHGKKSVSPPNLISPQSQLSILGALTAIQVLLASVWFVSKTPEPELVVSLDLSHTILKCKGDASPILMLLNLAMSVMFMTCCTVLAFKTRHFPKNFNEAKDIGVTLYVTCVIWSVFLPAYFLVSPWTDSFIREYLMSVVSIVVGYTSLFGLFGRKLNILIRNKEKPIQRKHCSPERKNRYDVVSRTVSTSIRKHICSSSVKSPSSTFRMIDTDTHIIKIDNKDELESSEASVKDI